MLTCSLLPWCILSECMLVSRNSVKLNLAGRGLKSKFGGKPAIFFSWGSLYITKFRKSWLVPKFTWNGIFCGLCTTSECVKARRYLRRGYPVQGVGDVWKRKRKAAAVHISCLRCCTDNVATATTNIRFELVSVKSSVATHTISASRSYCYKHVARQGQ